MSMITRRIVSPEGSSGVLLSFALPILVLSTVLLMKDIY